MTTYQPSGPRNFEDLVKPLPKGVQELANRLRAIVLDTMPEAEESVSGGATIGIALYSAGGPNLVVCGIQPTRESCKLFFHGWQELKKAGYPLEGVGKHARHIKLSGLNDLHSEEIAHMIGIAKTHARAGDV